MDCTRNLSRTWNRWSWALGIILAFFVPTTAHAAFASRFSLTVGEEYNDNIFFTKDKEHDFITIIKPTLTLLYAPEGQTVPTLQVNISPRGSFFVRHSDLNGFDNFATDGTYTYHYSPRLNFGLSNNFQRFGNTREGALGETEVQLRPTPTSTAPVGSSGPLPFSQNLKDFISSGDQITNLFSARASFLYRPNMSLTGNYDNSYAKFIDEGGSEFFHTIGFRGIYNWRQEHNLHAGYSVSIGKSRDDDTFVIHNFDFGDDFFSNYQIRLSPTLTLAASSGVSFNASGDGPSIANNTNVTITKIWETATLTGGVRKGLTPSFGVSGISDTTSVFTNFNMKITEKLTANSGVEFSLFDTDDVNFKTFRASMGMQYLLTSWLTSGLAYSHRWIDSGSEGASSSELLARGKVTGNSVYVYLTAHFDIWPRVGLARPITQQPPMPLITTPFPSPASSTIAPQP
jgi:hypothetical protein